MNSSSTPQLFEKFQYKKTMSSGKKVGHVVFLTCMLFFIPSSAFAHGGEGIAWVLFGVLIPMCIYGLFVLAGCASLIAGILRRSELTPAAKAIKTIATLFGGKIAAMVGFGVYLGMGYLPYRLFFQNGISLTTLICFLLLCFAVSLWVVRCVMRRIERYERVFLVLGVLVLIGSAIARHKRTKRGIQSSSTQSGTSAEGTNPYSSKIRILCADIGAHWTAEKKRQEATFRRGAPSRIMMWKQQENWGAVRRECKTVLDRLPKSDPLFEKVRVTVANCKPILADQL